MKRIVISIIFALAGIQAFSQQASSLQIRSNTGSHFWISIDGIFQSKEPQTMFTIYGIGKSHCRLTIVMDNPNRAEIHKKVMMNDKRGRPVDVAYAIDRVGKGKYTLKPDRFLPPNNNHNHSCCNITVITTNRYKSPYEYDKDRRHDDDHRGDDGHRDYDRDRDHDRNFDRDHDHDRNPQRDGCNQAMNQRDFQMAKDQIKKASFASDKKNIAQQILASGCITVEQLKEMLNLLSYESDKLEIAKVGYYSLADPEKFYLVNDCFSYSSSKEELNNFVRSQPDRNRRP